MSILVDPAFNIPPGTSAKVSHTDPGPLVITVISDTGAQDTIAVGAHDTYVWQAPPGWSSVTFKAPGHGSTFRTIAAEAGG